MILRTLNLYSRSIKLFFTALVFPYFCAKIFDILVAPSSFKTIWGTLVQIKDVMLGRPYNVGVWLPYEPRVWGNSESIDSILFNESNFSYKSSFDNFIFDLTLLSKTDISPTYLVSLFGAIIFFVGLTGIIICFRNIIVIFMSIEIMLFGFLLMILSLSVQYNDFVGVLLGLCILAIAGSESAIGLAMLVNYYTINKDVSIKVLSSLRF